MKCIWVWGLPQAPSSPATACGGARVCLRLPWHGSTYESSTDRSTSKLQPLEPAHRLPGKRPPLCSCAYLLDSPRLFFILLLAIHRPSFLPLACNISAVISTVSF
ncbi:hypothetical protein L211DRAFT_696625 [Terfezia boudieri ATCC MYA-4762]|uniref:Uncharacterized protein n=1 Tax=Terfezia boudieri ATCC MYA-4762 TaxID=1051890 RepID=A0A3N4M864_9PEZI|nr:hypothetical protein L211DRAFT_696625 [Terfezia boudieri ATCC MYA-4762]